MPTQQLENSPIILDLPALAKESGWTLAGGIAQHSSCNDGSMYLLGYPLTIGQSYEYSFDVLTVGSGYVEVFVGTNHGAQTTAPGNVHETIVANGNQLSIFSNGNCTITNFAIRIMDTIIDPKAQNTISFSEKTKKWVSFYTYIPEMAMSMFTKVFTGFNGDIYVHEAGTLDRNNFYGVQYQSIINFVDNVAPAVPKSFQSLSIQCNELMVTTTDGIQTSLGQLSELADCDFVKSFLSDGVTTVAVSAVEGVYSANLLRDKNSPGGLLEGNVLRGNYLLVELVSTSAEVLQLYTINVVAQYSPIGSR